MTGRTCDQEWGWDVDFDVACGRTPGHPLPHRAQVEGNGGVLATVEWPRFDAVCPNCGGRLDVDAEAWELVEIRTLCEPELTVVPFHDCPPPPERPTPLPDPVIPTP
jgi:hypothetical protein